MTNRIPPSPRDLATQLLDSEYNTITDPLRRAQVRDMNAGIIPKRVDELKAEIERLAEKGEKLTPDNPVYKALKSDVHDALKRHEALLDAISPDLIESGVNASGQVVRYGAIGSADDAALDLLGIAWNTPDPNAIAQVVEYTNSDAWKKLISSYGTGVEDVFQSIFEKGIKEGWGSDKITSELLKSIDTMTSYMANNLARTMQLTAYRDSAVLHRLANADILTYQIRIASLDGRCCMACVALHGTKLPIDKRIDDHHQGRCDSIAVVKGFTREVQSGVEWFKGLTPEQQKAQMKNNSAFEAWQKNEIELLDFVGEHSDAVFGPMVHQQSFTNMIHS